MACPRVPLPGRLAGDGAGPASPSGEAGRREGEHAGVGNRAASIDRECRDWDPRVHGVDRHRDIVVADRNGGSGPDRNRGARTAARTCSFSLFSIVYWAGDCTTICVLKIRSQLDLTS